MYATTSGIHKSGHIYSWSLTGKRSCKRPRDETIESVRLRELLAQSLGYVHGYYQCCSDNINSLLLLIPEEVPECTSQRTISAYVKTQTAFRNVGRN